MPLVKRIVDQKVETTHGVVHADHVFFVTKKQMRPTDSAVEPNDGQLSDLAFRYPNEWSGVGKLSFLELAKQRRVKVYEPEPEEPAERGEEQLTAMANMAVKMFPTLKDKDALALVEETTDIDVLKALFQAELDGDEPRESLIKAFKAKGLKVIEPEPEPEIDDGEPGQGTGEPAEPTVTPRPPAAPRSRRKK